MCTYTGGAELVVWGCRWSDRATLTEGVSAMNGTVLAIGERRKGGSPFIIGNKREIRERQLGLSNSSRFEAGEQDLL